MALLNNRTIGGKGNKFTIVRKIGGGSFGDIYLAVDTYQEVHKSF